MSPPLFEDRRSHPFSGAAHVVTSRVGRWMVVVSWLLLGAVALPFAAELSDQQTNDSSAWLPKDAESTRVRELAAAATDPDIFSTLVVYQSPSGVTDDEMAAARRHAQQFGRLDVVRSTAGPILSPDGHVVRTVVEVDLTEGGWTRMPEVAESLRSIAGLVSTGSVITSAGLVLAATFLVLGTLPMVAFAQIGIAVAVGVLLDTLVVRTPLVPALLSDLGHWAWWPRRVPHRG